MRALLERKHKTQVYTLKKRKKRKRVQQTGKPTRKPRRVQTQQISFKINRRNLKNKIRDTPHGA